LTNGNRSTLPNPALTAYATGVQRIRIETTPVTLYRLLISLFALVALLGALRKEGVQAARARLSPGSAPEGVHVWLHGASNGELASVRPVLARLVVERPDLRWLVTANTPTGVDLAEGWALPRVSARLAPLDLRAPTRRLMRDWRIGAHVALESELWPNRLMVCPGPVLVLGARMSAGSARTWARFPRLAHSILAQIAFASAQDARSADRLLALGLPRTALGPVTDLKAYYAPPAPPTDPVLDAAFPRARTWLAASTHEGDEAVALAAHAILLKDTPDLRLILAPRHPGRADAIAAEIRNQGFDHARRSEGTDPGDAQVYLADTMGEMPLWYSRAGRVFIGGTLTDRGGHTPYEPAAYGAALLHGPDTRNFAPAYAALSEARASRLIDDATTLAAALRALGPPAAQTRAGATAQDALQPRTDIEDLVMRILAFLPPR
jgi:3-deoxy-D-manno-octulosonic-acid transferase